MANKTKQYPKDEEGKVNNGSSATSKSDASYKGKGGSKSKKRRNSSAPQSKSGTPSEGTGYDAIKSNDITWWNNSPMFSDATRVPFNRIYGDPIRGLGGSYTDYPNPGSSEEGRNVDIKRIPYSTPGVMTMYFRPTIGTTTGGANAPVNRAFTSLYGEIYSKTTGAMQFQQADLALFVTSLASVAMLIAVVKRALGVSKLYSSLNYYYPQQLLTALGIDPDSVIGHQDRIREMINNSILSFNNLKVPDFMSIYKRWYSLCHNIYADEDDVTSQLFAFVPVNVYIYSDTEEFGGELHSLDTGFVDEDGYPGKLKIEEVIVMIDDMLNVWRNSTDLGLISGSIQRAFSDRPFVVIDRCEMDDVVIPTPDRNMMWQINNLSTLPLDPNTLDVTQNPVGNYLTFKPEMSKLGDGSQFSYVNYYNAIQEQILNSYDGTTDAEFIMEATRLMAIPIDPLTESTVSPLRYINTEVVDHWRVWAMVWDYHLNQPMLTYSERLGSQLFIESPDSMEIEDFFNIMNSLGLMSRFKLGPRFSFGTYAADHDPEIPSWLRLLRTEPIGDLYKYTTVDRESLRGLNEAALQSVYAFEF